MLFTVTLDLSFRKSFVSESSLMRSKKVQEVLEWIKGNSLNAVIEGEVEWKSSV